MIQGNGGGRRGGPTLRDVARRAEVSLATASRALASDYPVAEETRARVLKAVAELQYVVSSRAPKTPPTGPRTIAMVVPDLISPLHAHVSAGVTEAAEDAGRISLIYPTDADRRREEQAIEHLRGRDDVDAVIMVGGVHVTPEYERRMAAYARGLAAKNARLVLCGRPQLSREAPVLVVEYDNRGGAYAMTSHLLSLGHRRILTLTGPARSTTTIGRVAGYRDAHADFGLTPDDGLIIECGADRSGGHQGCVRALESGLDFTAIFAHNDLMASGALAVLRDHGLSVPDQISVAGYDNLPVAQELAPPLTTVYMPHEELGRMAVRLAMERPAPGSGRDHLLLGTHIVIRESVGPPRRPE